MAALPSDFLNLKINNNNKNAGRRKNGMSRGIFDVFSKKTVREIPVDEIALNPDQPRKSFDGDKLDSLARSIRENGIIQPLCVRRLDKGGWQLISGERRLKAAKSLMMKHVPCIVVSADSERSAVLALVENLQREDLDFFEEASGIKHLIDSYSLTREQAAGMLSLSPSALSNKLRLLRLPKEQIEKIRNCNLSERHARALLRISDSDKADELLNKMIAECMTAAQAEQLVRDYLEQDGQKEKCVRKKTAAVKDARILANTLERAVESIRRAGINARSEKSENEDFIEYRITVQKHVKSEEPVTIFPLLTKIR